MKSISFKQHIVKVENISHIISMGRKNNLKFTIHKGNKGYFVTVKHVKLDINYNSLTEKVIFNHLEEAKNFCNNFDYKQYNCFNFFGKQII